MTNLYIGENGDGKKVHMDLHVVMRSNLLMQAASGGGKSWALRRLAEQACKHVPVGIIDPEGEFASLREKFPFVLIGPGGETPADPRSAAMVAKRMLELGCSFVADIFELKPHLRHVWVRDFIDAFIDAPKRLWRSFLLMLDEAHIYAPEGGHGRSKATSVALNAVADMASRGRKRGYGFVCATQRLGKFHKDVAAELKNAFIGQTTLDIDRERAAEALGKRRLRGAERDAFDRDMKNMQPGTFYGLGPAISVDPMWMRFGPVRTTHPEPGKRTRKAPPPISQIKNLLPQLADLPAEAEKELKTVADLKAELRKVRGELGRALSGTTVEKEIQRVEVPIVPTKLADSISQLATQVAHAEDVSVGAFDNLKAFAQRLQEQLDALHVGIVTEGTRMLPPPHRRDSYNGAKVKFDAATQAVADDAAAATLGKGERAILTAIATHSNPGVAVVTTQQLTVLTGYKRSSRDTYLHRLRAAGFIERQNGGYVITSAGVAALGSSYQPLPTGAALRDHYMQTLPEGERRIFDVVCKFHPQGVQRGDLESATGYKRSSRDTYIHRLKARQLVVVEGGIVKASEHLF